MAKADYFFSAVFWLAKLGQQACLLASLADRYDWYMSSR